MKIHYKHNVKLTPNARILRKGMTEEERKLWYVFLRALPVRVLRQKVVDDYIVDFYCAEARLVIEIDGSQHYEELGERKDKIRDRHLSEKRGLEVLRFSNEDIRKNFQAVCDAIENKIKEKLEK